MESLNLKSWDKASYIYRGSLVLTVIILAVIIPRFFPPGSIPVQFLIVHNQWAEVLMVPVIYVFLLFLPLIFAFLLEACLFLFTRTYSMNRVMKMCFILWVFLALAVIAAAVDVWIYNGAHHLHVLMPPKS
jgi:hypothetical protein